MQGVEQNIVIETVKESGNWVVIIAAVITALGAIFAAWLGLRKR